MAAIEPPPTGSQVTSDVIDPGTGKTVDSRLFSRDWTQWFFALTGQLDKTARSAANVALPPTTVGTINPTSILVLPANGLYRISYYARITQPGTVSSSLTVMFKWTDTGVQQTYTGPAMTGNTTTTQQSATFLVRGDAATGIYFQTTYVANAANTMKYSVDIVVEAVQ